VVFSTSKIEKIILKRLLIVILFQLAMKKKLDIPKDFWKDFKDRKDFDEFFNELFKEGINQLLKAEMTDHLGYEKHSKDGDNQQIIQDEINKQQ